MSGGKHVRVEARERREMKAREACQKIANKKRISGEEERMNKKREKLKKKVKENKQ